MKLRRCGKKQHANNKSDPCSPSDRGVGCKGPGAEVWHAPAADIINARPGLAGHSNGAGLRLMQNVNGGEPGQAANQFPS